jgi:ribose transport system permease protein
MSAPTASITTPTGRIGSPVARAVARFALPLVLVVLVVGAAISTPVFLTFDNIRGVLLNASITGIAAVGMTAMTLSGNMFSLGAGSSTMLASMLFVALPFVGIPPIVAGIVAVLVLVALGVLQALAVAAGLNPVVTTLATGTIVLGAVTVASGGAVIPAPAEVGWLATASFLGIPLPVYVFVVVTAVAWFLHDRTTIGRRIVLLGANRAAARTSGLAVRRLTVWAFVIMSIGFAIAGILSAAELGQVTANNLSTLTVDAVAAVLVGGTAIQGGEGSPLRTAVGGLIIVILQNVMLLHGLPHGVRSLGVGALALVIVIVLHLARRAAAR